MSRIQENPDHPDTRFPVVAYCFHEGGNTIMFSSTLFRDHRNVLLVQLEKFTRLRHVRGPVRAQRPVRDISDDCAIKRGCLCLSLCVCACGATREDLREISPWTTSVGPCVCLSASLLGKGSDTTQMTHKVFPLVLFGVNHPKRGRLFASREEKPPGSHDSVARAASRR